MSRGHLEAIHSMNSIFSGLTDRINLVENLYDINNTVEIALSESFVAQC